MANSKSAKPVKKPLPTVVKRPAGKVGLPMDAHVKTTLEKLKRLGTLRTRESLSRYGITGPTAETAFGVSVGEVRAVGKEITKRNGGPNHELALALWETGNYEAQLLAAFVGDPERVTSAQMDRWCKDFDNWGVCDTVCFHLFDRSPHAMAKVTKWATEKGEFQKRAAFALLASAALHNKHEPDDVFLKTLPLIEAASNDERNFVKKGVLWALRGVGSRTTKRKAAAIKLAEKLGKSSDATARWIGKTAIREMTKA